MKVALYLRRSTNEQLQADSLRVQEQVLRAYAKDHEMTVVALFKDSASGTSVKKRHQFLEMVDVITHGANFEAILVRDVSRFGRFFDTDEAAFWETVFLGHKVKTIYVEEVFGSDTSPMATLVKSVRRVMASEHSRDKSRIVRYGQSRVTRLGFRYGGPPPYGMKRVMVTLDGEFVQELQKGEWKGLSNRRTKLVKGDPAEVAVVEKIFDLYGSKGWGSTQISNYLNSEGIPSPHGSRWYEPTVANMLENPAYAGTASYRVRWKGSVDPLPEAAAESLDAERAESFEGIVAIQTFEAVQNRLKARTNRRTDAALTTDLRDAYVRHGCAESKMLTTLSAPCSWATYSHRFRSPDEALRAAYAKEIEIAAERFRDLASGAFTVTEIAGGYLMDGVLRVRLQSAFLHAGTWFQGWKFPSEPGDHHVIVGFGVSPDGTSPDHFFVLRRSRLDGMRRGLIISKSRLPVPGNETVVSPADLPVVLGRMRYSTDDAEKMFMELVSTKSLVNFAEMSRELGWRHHNVRNMYWRLVNGGVTLPPLKMKAGRRVEFICGGCGLARWESPSDVLVRLSDLCGICVRQRSNSRIVVRCPSCGKEGTRWPSAVKKLSSGANTVCRNCNIKTSHAAWRAQGPDRI